MSNKITLSLITLPVELVYRILDKLDDFTIFCSMQNVCTRINAIVNTYHRYQVNFFFTVKSNIPPTLSERTGAAFLRKRVLIKIRKEEEEWNFHPKKIKTHRHKNIINRIKLASDRYKLYMTRKSKKNESFTFLFLVINYYMCCKECAGGGLVRDRLAFLLLKTFVLSSKKWSSPWVL